MDQIHEKAELLVESQGKLIENRLGKLSKNEREELVTQHP